ncbi:18953_t:CDS:2 [Funneliformis geosporum]|nr:18953_t:CDS:2 [Funneliformis geosporum]
MANELNKDEQGIKLDEETIDTLFGTLSLDKYQQNSKRNSAKENIRLQRSPFDEFKISSTSILDTLNARSLCPKCARSMKFFCYWCYQVVGCQRTPDDVSIYSNLDIPKYENPSRLLLLFPGPDSKTLNEISKDSFDKLLVVDGTWQQATSLTKFTQELKNIRKITIKPQKTLFWRYQNKSENHLATIEALYYFLKEYYEVYESDNDDHRYDGRYDDLLWYYKYLYEFIQATYSKSQKPYTSRHRQGYIEYDNK